MGLCINHCQKKLLWPRLKAALTHEYKNKYLEDSLTMRTFSKTTIISSLLGLMPFPVMSRFPASGINSLLWRNLCVNPLDIPNSRVSICSSGHISSASWCYGMQGSALWRVKPVSAVSSPAACIASPNTESFLLGQFQPSVLMSCIQSVCCIQQ